MLIAEGGGGASSPATRPKQAEPKQAGDSPPARDPLPERRPAAETDARDGAERVETRRRDGGPDAPRPVTRRARDRQPEPGGQPSPAGDTRGSRTDERRPEGHPAQGRGVSATRRERERYERLREVLPFLPEPPKPDLPDHRTWLDRHDRTGTPTVIAHRGRIEDGAAPNSIDSLEDAAADGRSDAVEMDIQRLKDGTIVVYHDGDDPEIGDDVEQLDRDDLKDHPQVPTLEQWAKRAGELDVNVMAEFKESGYEREALDILKEHVKPKRLVAMSFDPDAVRGVHEADSRIPVGLVIARGDDAAPVEEQVDDLGFTPRFIEVNHENDDDEVFDAMVRRGIDVLVGRDDHVDQHRYVEDGRINAILTDKPTQAFRLREGHQYVDDDGELRWDFDWPREHRARPDLDRLST